MVSGYSTSTSIPRVDGLSTGPPGFGASQYFFIEGMERVMHIAMHVKSTKRLPTHDVIYSIVPWYLKERHNLSKVPFGPSVIVKLFHLRFFHGPMVVNGRRVPLENMDSKKKRK